MAMQTPSNHRMLLSSLIILSISGVCLGGDVAIARPSGDVTLSFARPGRVGKVLVKEGQAVEAGDVLVQLDDEVERIRLARLKVKAENDTMVRAREAQLEQKKLDRKRCRDVAKQGAATELEVQHAELDVKVAELSLALAQLEQTQLRREYEEAKAELKRMTLVSPIEGLVQEIFVSKGESPGAHTKVIRLVKIDPLWADVPVPPARAKDLTVGQGASVFVADDTKPHPGKIIFKSAVLDSASHTLTVRVEVPNPSGLPAGERVRVEFGKSKAAAAPAKTHTGDDGKGT